MIPRLVILDRDRTLMRVPSGRSYVFGNDEMQFARGAVDLIAALNAAGVRVVVATNQQAIALPEFPDITVESADRFHDRIQAALAAQGASIDRFYICPHAADAGCACRKPRPGLFLQALHDFAINPGQAAAVGDQPRDLEAALAAGIRSLYLLSPDPEAQEGFCNRLGARTVASLATLQSGLLPTRC